MKKIILTLIITTFCSAIFAQTQIRNTFFQISKLPASFELISGNQLTHFDAVFDHTYAKDLVNAKFLSNGQVLVSIEEQKDLVKPLRKSLESYQQEVVNRLNRDKKSKLSQSEIIKIGQIRYLIIKSKRNSDELITFTTDYTNSFGRMTGIIEFKAKDRKLAEKALKEILENTIRIEP